MWRTWIVAFAALFLMNCSSEERFIVDPPPNPEPRVIGSEPFGPKVSADGNKTLEQYNVNPIPTPTETPEQPGLEGGIEIPEAGEYVFSPNWYCSAAWMSVSLVSPSEVSLEGKFGGDCWAPGYPVGPFYPQKLGEFQAGDRLILKLSTEHSRLGNVENLTTRSGLCYIDDISTEHEIAFQFTCDDGYDLHMSAEDFLGPLDDIQFKVFKMRNSTL